MNGAVVKLSKGKGCIMSIPGRTAVGATPDTAIIAEEEAVANPFHGLLVGMNKGTLCVRVIVAGHGSPARSVVLPNGNLAEVNHIPIERVNDQFVVIPTLVAHEHSGSAGRRQSCPGRNAREGVIRAPNAKDGAKSEKASGVLNADVEG